MLSDKPFHSGSAVSFWLSNALLAVHASVANSLYTEYQQYVHKNTEFIVQT